jgi:hypothetical protein
LLAYWRFVSDMWSPWLPQAPMLRMPIAARRRQPSFRYSIRGSCWVRRDQCSRLAGFSVRLSRSPEQRRVSIAGLPRAEFRSHIRAGRYCLRADTMIRPVFPRFYGGFTPFPAGQEREVSSRPPSAQPSSACRGGFSVLRGPPGRHGWCATAGDHR